ncbi:MAG: hypothetical protein AMXMBFR7_41540 [Planctomycetota bacterium]
MAAKKKPKSKPVSEPKLKLPRPGGTYFQLFNSGLEVWLYDDAQQEKIRASGALAFGEKGQEAKFKAQAKKGLVVGYSLRQDDSVSVAVYVGEPLTEQELSASRWLEPQRAFLDLPSGKLCVESNDSCRVMPEAEPTDKGGTLKVPPGKYRVTLYRSDHEALAREELAWHPPQEVVVLTPGGKPADAAKALLPFQPRRDLSWKGKYAIRGKQAEVLVWFYDYRDSFVVNLDAAAVKQLGLKHGQYFQTRVPELKVTLVSVFAPSWLEGRKLPRPNLEPLTEYGFAMLSPQAEWNGAEALFARRERANLAVDKKQQGVWFPGIFEVLDVGPMEVKPGPQGTSFESLDLVELEHCGSDFLATILGDVLNAGDLDELTWADALKRLDAEYAQSGLKPVGDLRWNASYGDDALQFDLRLYVGAKDTLGALVTRELSIEPLLLSERDDGSWLATGLCDTFEAIVTELKGRGKKVNARIENRDEPFEKIRTAHTQRLKEAPGKPVAAATDLDSAREAIGRFLAAVFV